MPEVIDMKKVKWELKKRELKEKASVKVAQARDFVNQNRESNAPFFYFFSHFLHHV